jgi:hypothetical protein
MQVGSTGPMVFIRRRKPTPNLENPRTLASSARVFFGINSRWDKPASRGIRTRVASTHSRYTSQLSRGLFSGALCIANAQTLRLQLRSWTNCNLTDQLQLDANQLQLDGPIATRREPIASRPNGPATRDEPVAITREPIATKRTTDCNCDTTLIATRWN